jgi:hypothetical protein
MESYRNCGIDGMMPEYGFVAAVAPHVEVYAVVGLESQIVTLISWLQ